MEEIKHDWSDLNDAAARRIATSPRTGLEVLSEIGRGIIRRVIDVTPPGHEGVKGGTREAQAHGEAKVAGDIRKLYGGPGDAYDALRSVSPGSASAFWFLRNHGDAVAAKQIVNDKLGMWYGPFDGGKIHEQNFRNGGVRGRRGKPVIYVDDDNALNSFIQEKQGHVHYLVAGWAETAARLGIRLPQLVTKHNAPGMVLVNVSETRIQIIATNAVGYASDTGLQRRVQWAIDGQTDAINRQWEHWQKKINAQSGL